MNVIDTTPQLFLNHTKLFWLDIIGHWDSDLSKIILPNLWRNKYLLLQPGFLTGYNYNILYISSFTKLLQYT